MQLQYWYHPDKRNLYQIREAKIKWENTNLLKAAAKNTRMNINCLGFIIV